MHIHTHTDTIARNHWNVLGITLHIISVWLIAREWKHGNTLPSSASVSIWPNFLQLVLTTHFLQLYGTFNPRATWPPTNYICWLANRFTSARRSRTGTMDIASSATPRESFPRILSSCKTMKRNLKSNIAQFSRHLLTVSFVAKMKIDTIASISSKMSSLFFANGTNTWRQFTR